MTVARSDSSGARAALAELSSATEAVAGYRRRVADLVGPGLGPDQEELVSAIYEAERALATAERLLERARKLAG